MSGRVAGLRAETREVFLPRVLAILAERLSERFGPGSVIAIRSLRLACRVRPSDLRDPAQAERIFEPFFTTGSGGTGLGLFISRELCQTNGALLLYEPRPGGGSIFRIIFADPSRWKD
jgi:hypothetical protein